MVGYVGIVLGMAALGALLAGLHRSVERQPLLRPAHFIVFVAMIRMLLDVSEIFQAMGIVLVRVSLVVWAMSWLTQRLIGGHPASAARRSDIAARTLGRERAV